MKKAKITLTDETQIEMTEEEFLHADLMEICKGKAIINVEFFEESDL